MEKKRPEEGSRFDVLEWEEVSRKTLVHNEWIDFRESKYRFPDGSVFEPFYSYSRRDYVVVVATDVDGRYICVRQFRQGIKEVTTEFPAGGIERKDGREYAGRAEFETDGAGRNDAAADANDSADAADPAVRFRPQFRNPVYRHAGGTDHRAEGSGVLDGHHQRVRLGRFHAFGHHHRSHTLRSKSILQQCY